MQPNERRKVFHFQIEEARTFEFTDWSLVNAAEVDGRIKEYLDGRKPFIYYRDGPAFSVYKANEQYQLNLAITTINKLRNHC